MSPAGVIIAVCVVFEVLANAVVCSAVAIAVAIFKLRQEGPEATIVLPVIENNHQMTTRAKSRADFQVEMVTTEQQKTFQQLAIKIWNILPASIKEINTMTQFKKTLKSFLTKERNNPFSRIK